MRSREKKTKSLAKYKTQLEKKILLSCLAECSGQNNAIHDGLSLARFVFALHINQPFLIVQFRKNIIIKQIFFIINVSIIKKKYEKQTFLKYFLKKINNEIHSWAVRELIFERWCLRIDTLPFYTWKVSFSENWAIKTTGNHYLAL